MYTHTFFRRPLLGLKLTDVDWSLPLNLYWNSRKDNSQNSATMRSWIMIHCLFSDLLDLSFFFSFLSEKKDKTKQHIPILFVSWDFSIFTVFVVAVSRVDQTTTVDGSEILHQSRLVAYPIIYKVLYIPGPRWFSRRISEPSTVSPSTEQWKKGPLVV